MTERSIQVALTGTKKYTQEIKSTSLKRHKRAKYVYDEINGILARVYFLYSKAYD